MILLALWYQRLPRRPKYALLRNDPPSRHCEPAQAAVVISVLGFPSTRDCSALLGPRNDVVGAVRFLGTRDCFVGAKSAHPHNDVKKTFLFLN